MSKQSGICLWFTGPSGAGKSTIAEALASLLIARGCSPAILDVVPGLHRKWFERTSRNKLLRKAVAAASAVRRGETVICVAVSARLETREEIRRLIGAGNFVETFVDAPPEVCLARKAHRGKKQSLVKRARFACRRVLGRLPFWPRSSYQPPRHPDITINTTVVTPGEGAQAVLQWLVDRGYVDAPEPMRNLSSGAGESGAQMAAALSTGRRSRN